MCVVVITSICVKYSSVYVFRFCAVPAISDVSSWISAGDDVLSNSLPSFSDKNSKNAAIVIDSLSRLIFSLSVDDVCQLLSRLCRQTASKFFSNTLPVTDFSLEYINRA